MSPRAPLETFVEWLAFAKSVPPEAPLGPATAGDLVAALESLRIGLPRLKRYLLFVYDTYYPTGGWNDFRGSFDTYDAAATEAVGLYGDHWHVIDGDSGERVDPSTGADSALPPDVLPA